MRRHICASVGTLWLCCAASAATPPLGFYIAYSKAAPGLHEVECRDFSTPGYIREKPDFPITRVEDIRIEVYPHQRNPTKLVFRFTPEDAKAFAAFTARRGEVRLFLMFGSEPLAEYGFIARVLTRELLVGLPPGSDPQKLKQQLQAFVVKPDET